MVLFWARSFQLISDCPLLETKRLLFTLKMYFSRIFLKPFLKITNLRAKYICWISPYIVIPLAALTFSIYCKTSISNRIVSPALSGRVFLAHIIYLFWKILAARHRINAHFCGQYKWSLLKVMAFAMHTHWCSQQCAVLCQLLSLLMSSAIIFSIACIISN